MKICPKCGKKLRDEAVFCSECGSDVKDLAPVEIVQTPVATNVNQAPVVQGNGSIIPIIFGGLSILIAIFSFFVYADKSMNIWYFASGVRMFLGTSLPAFTTIILAYIDLSNGKKKTLPMIALILGGFSLFLLFINSIVYSFLG